MIKRTIAGISLSLKAGKRYVATRPMGKFSDVTVSITEGAFGDLAETIPGLTYDEANEFTNEFNNEKSSFSGRVWE